MSLALADQLLVVSCLQTMDADQQPMSLQEALQRIADAGASRSKATLHAINHAVLTAAKHHARRSGHHAAADELERMIQDVRQHTGARVSRTIDLDEIAAASFPDRPS